MTRLYPLRPSAPLVDWEDDVERRDALCARRPDAEVTFIRTHDWRGSLRVGDLRRSVAAIDLGTLLDLLERLERIDAVMCAFPGWSVWVSEFRDWYAVRCGPVAAWTRAGHPVTVAAENEGALRAQLAALAVVECP